MEAFKYGNLTKLEPKTFPAFYLGPAMDGQGFRVYNPETKRISVTRSFTPIKDAGPKLVPNPSPSLPSDEEEKERVSDSLSLIPVNAPPTPEAPVPVAPPTPVPSPTVQVPPVVVPPTPVAPQQEPPTPEGPPPVATPSTPPPQQDVPPPLLRTRSLYWVCLLPLPPLHPNQ